MAESNAVFRAIDSMLINLNSIAFRGRMSRKAYWRFFPFGIALPIAAFFVAFVVDATYLARVLAAVLFAIPLLSANFRRLQDTGENGNEALMPWGYFAMSACTFFCAYQLFYNAYSVFGLERSPLPYGNLVGDLLFGLASLCLVALALVLFIRFLMQFSVTTGQLLLPSQPGPNEYGPNPNEVPQ
ncbi:DUF805 domain-containing protein [Marivita sp. S6314]|uniref:DUF805 domain-containing protein n=1 Tax=Marivita sp. S6314 TaxID=2926406 RepID=UPI001FF21409|nr:DUF805 domain-containing protein [Marivita sp. S6314]MCK0150550.1 DUF805 domain-containing protein [Marivita sp. S6314]